MKTTALLPTLLILLTLLASGFAYGQRLEPGFNKEEYLDLMKISAQFGDSAYRESIPVPPQYTLAYHSPTMGLGNLWELWTSDNQVAIISIRGTTEESESWLANLYAAMVSAQGELKIGEETTFQYHLASNPQAAVHVGWLVSTAFLANDILPKVDSCYQAGIKDVIIMGHSQGGAIAYLLTAHLYSLQKQEQLPPDLRMKTYCSAAPKPGNLYFAYEYEALTQAGWGFNVVNSADWVPEVPVSIQTLDDFNEINPFTNIQSVIDQQKLMARIALNSAYKKLYKPTQKAQENYQKLLGDYTSRNVKKIIPGFEAPAYYSSNHYVRTGSTIVLLADEEYLEWNPRKGEKVFPHHFHPQYMYLAEKLDFSSSFSTTDAMNEQLSGTWELEYITGPRIAFDGLYPNRKPQINFDLAQNELKGNTSCNSFNSGLILNQESIHISEPTAMTKVACEGTGESVFLSFLQKAEHYALEADDKLTFFKGDIPIMRFHRIN
uniref:META domain-containing protein n=1 Tax=Roseihalotalea indica TaxID=2867963 RepID=A0AA49JFZ2_9BACT|nr:META domain-containing protein [Tunicatimonas sp. TK19036]